MSPSIGMASRRRPERNPAFSRDGPVRSGAVSGRLRYCRCRLRHPLARRFVEGGSSGFHRTLAGGNFGLLLGSLCAGLLGDRFGRKPVLIGSVAAFGLFSLLIAFAASPSQLAGLRFLTGLGLGGGIPVAIALAADFAPEIAPGRLVMLTSVGVPIGFAVGGLATSQLVTHFRLAGDLRRWRRWAARYGPAARALAARSPWPRPGRRHRNPVAALFWYGRTPIHYFSGLINFLSLLGVYFILLWAPAILHNAGASPSRAIFATTMYALV